MFRHPFPVWCIHPVQGDTFNREVLVLQNTHEKTRDLELLLASHMNSYRHACNRVHISAPNVSYRHALHMHCMQTHNSRGCIRHRCIRITHSVLPLHAPRPARICLELLPRAATCCHTCITSGMHTIGVHTTMTPTAYILL